MTKEEILNWQAKEKAFNETPVGKAFNRFRNAYHRSVLLEFKDGPPTRRDCQIDDEAKEAEKVLKDEIRKLLP